MAYPLALALAFGAPTSDDNNVFEVNISPEEAQQYIRNPPFGEPSLSVKTAELPLVKFNDPRFRTADAGPTNGHYWKNGKEIENTDDYVEEVYEASQYHGQDGLGEYGYGYKTPESAKVENRQHSGDVTGTYTYRAPNNFLVKVRYWADSEGFHQEDNLPKPELPVGPEEPVEIREARLAHQKAWEEAAAASRGSPDPEGEYDPSKYELDGSASENKESTVQNADSRQGRGYQQAAYQGGYNKPQQGGFKQGTVNQQPSNYPVQQQQSTFQAVQQPKYQQSSYQQQSSTYQKGGYQQQQSGSKQPAPQQQSGSNQVAYQQKQQNDEEEQGTEYPPKGFFYSFNYPVSILVNKEEQSRAASEGNSQYHVGSPVDHDTVGVSSPYHG